MKAITLSLCILLLLGTASGCNTKVIQESATGTSISGTSTTKTAKPLDEESTYNKATQALKDNNAIAAYALFSRLSGYKDSRQKAESLRYVLYYFPFHSSDMYITNKGNLKHTGTTVIASGLGALSLSILSDWSNIYSVCYGKSLIGLKTDGTAALFGNKGPNGDSSREVAELSKWTDIVQIKSSESAVFGLRKDGTIAIPEYLSGLPEYTGVAGWTGIIQISFGGGVLYGLKSDGTVTASGKSVQVADGVIMLSDKYALKNDGSVSDLSGSGKEIPANWKDIIAIFANQMKALALNSDGILIDDRGNEYAGNGDLIYAQDLYEQDIIGVRTNGSICVIDSATNEHDSSKAMKGITDVILPADIAKKFDGKTNATAQRFDPSNISYVSIYNFPQLDKKYSTGVRIVGSGDCIDIDEYPSLLDKSGNVIIKPAQWLSIEPLTDDRFLLMYRNPDNAQTLRAVIVDRDEQQTSSVNAIYMKFKFENEINMTGIANIISDKPGKYEECCLINIDGAQISEFYDTISYSGVSKTFTAARDGVTYTLDLDGKQIQ